MMIIAAAAAAVLLAAAAFLFRRRRRREEPVYAYVNRCCLCGAAIDDERMVCRECEIREGLTDVKTKR